MAIFKISKKAIADLDAIWNYTAQTWSERQADRYYTRIYESIINLSSIPDYQTRYYDVVKPGLRGYQVGHHIIFYKKRNDGLVWVDRILHEKMDHTRHFVRRDVH